MTDRNYSDDLMQVFYALARKYAFDMGGYVSLCQSLKQKLLDLWRDNGDPETVKHYSSIIRCNRTIKFASKDKSFHVIGELGRGIFGRVELVVLKEDSNSMFALKNILIPTRKNLQFQYTKIIIEKESLWLCDNPKYVVPLIACWVEHGYANKPDNICLLSEYMSHGDFSNVIKQLYPLTADRKDRRNFDGLFEKKSDEFFKYHSEDEIRKLKLMLMETETSIIFGNPDTFKDYMQIIVRYIHSLLKAVEYLHSKEIVHRDIKPGNILVNEQLEIKLSDFGMVTPFKAIHERKLYGWMTNCRLKESQFNDLFEFKDIEYQRNSFNQQRNAFGKVTEVVGTKIFLAPEYMVPDSLWEETFHHPKPNIMVKKHYPADWYAIGCVISALCNGLHPIVDVLGFYSRPDTSIEKNRVLNLIRINPTDKNPLLYDEDNYCRASYGDHRLLEIVRGLLHPHPDKRSTGSKILNSRHFLDLKSRYMRSDQPIMSYWNRYVSTQTKSKGELFLEDFLSNPNESYKSTIGRSHHVHRIPETAILPMSTKHLGPLSFAMSSPRKRYRRVLNDMDTKIMKTYSPEGETEDGQRSSKPPSHKITSKLAISDDDENSEKSSKLEEDDEEEDEGEEDEGEEDDGEDDEGEEDDGEDDDRENMEDGEAENEVTKTNKNKKLLKSNPKKRRVEDQNHEAVPDADGVDISDEFSRKLKKNIKKRTFTPSTRFGWHEAEPGPNGFPLSNADQLESPTPAYTSPHDHQFQVTNPSTSEEEHTTRYINIAVPVSATSVRNQNIHISVPVQNKEIHITIPMDCDSGAPMDSRTEDTDSRAGKAVHSHDISLSKKSSLSSRLTKLDELIESENETIGMDSSEEEEFANELVEVEVSDTVDSRKEKSDDPDEKND